MNWGAKIVVSFVVFIGVIFTMVYISVNQDISLVAENYYEEELAYEDQIQRIKNSNELVGQLNFKVDRAEQLAKVTFPESILTDFKEGTVRFYRPSSARFDQEFTMTPENGMQQIDIANFKRGLWKVKLNWKSSGKEFYKEITMVL